MSTVNEPVQTSTATTDPVTFEVEWDLSGFAPGRYSMNILVADIREGDDAQSFGMQIGVTVTE